MTRDKKKDITSVNVYTSILPQKVRNVDVKLRYLQIFCFCVAMFHLCLTTMFSFHILFEMSGDAHLRNVLLRISQRDIS